MKNVDFITNQKNEFVDLPDFVSKLRADKKLRNTYIISVRIWFQYFKKCASNRQPFDQTSIDRLHINLSKLIGFFLPDEYPELYAALKELEDLMNELPQNMEAKGQPS